MRDDAATERIARTVAILRAILPRALRMRLTCIILHKLKQWKVS